MIKELKEFEKSICKKCKKGSNCYFPQTINCPVEYFINKYKKEIEELKKKLTDVQQHISG